MILFWATLVLSQIIVVYITRRPLDGRWQSIFYCEESRVPFLKVYLVARSLMILLSLMIWQSYCCDNTPWMMILLSLMIWRSCGCTDTIRMMMLLSLMIWQPCCYNVTIRMMKLLSQIIWQSCCCDDIFRMIDSTITNILTIML